LIAQKIVACTYSTVISLLNASDVNLERVSSTLPTRVKAGPSHSLAGDAGQEALRMGGQVQAPKPGRLDWFRLVDWVNSDSMLVDSSGGPTWKWCKIQEK